MIIDTKTIIVTLLIVSLAAYAGLQFIRSFALSIAQENHDANLAIDMTEEARRTKRENDADAAATAAFAKVEPLLPASVVSKGMSLSSDVENTGGVGVAKQAQAQSNTGGGLKAVTRLTGSPPSSGGAPNVVKIIIEDEDSQPSQTLKTEASMESYEEVSELKEESSPV